MAQSSLGWMAQSCFDREALTQLQRAVKPRRGPQPAIVRAAGAGGAGMGAQGTAKAAGAAVFAAAAAAVTVCAWAGLVGRKEGVWGV